jgi:hypothetical protein
MERGGVENRLMETKKEPKPCPKCGSDNIEVDSGGMTTSMKGIDYQCIWVECRMCEFDHQINIVDYPMEEYPTQLCIKQWNDIPTDSGNQ